MTTAAEVKPGDWIFQQTGSYLVDGVTLRNGLAFIGTRYGVLVVSASSELVVAS